MKIKQIKNNRNRTRNLFLLTFFDKNSRYEEKLVNGYWLVRNFNGETKDWQVAIYTREKFKRYKQWNGGQKPVSVNSELNNTAHDRPTDGDDGDF